MATVSSLICDYTYIVIGGGIAGVTCTETLSSVCPEQSVLLLSASPIIKAVTNLKQLSRALQEFDVEEKQSSELTSRCSNVTIAHETVVKFKADEKVLVTQSGSCYRYKKLCLCTGGQPKLIADGSPFVLGIRDTETALEFEKKLANARRVVIVGNGGIATELVYRISSCDVVWAIKDKSIVSTFVDAGAAKFFLPQLGVDATPPEGPVKRTRYQLNEDVSATTKSLSTGAALGPDWTNILPLRGLKQGSQRVHVEYEVEVRRLWTPEELKASDLKVSQTPSQSDTTTSEDSWPVYVELTNGHIFGCDFVISATGVVPNIWPFTTDCSQFAIADDGGIKVDGRMQTTVADVYAAGDVCHAAWPHSAFWLQMRLWIQAYQMGYYAAQCMASSEIATSDANFLEPPTEICFELFAHVTKFFGYKVVLLGRFNGQGLNDDYQLLIRVTEGKEYVKAVMRNGRMVGAVLIGETDLEETFENLILNQLDLSVYGDELLNQPIEDFFD